MNRIFDPIFGNATFLTLPIPVLTELSMRVADAAAERGDEALADSFWQMGAMTANKEN